MLTTMVLSTRCIPNHLPILTSCTSSRSILQLNFSLPLKPKTFALNNPGLRYHNYSSIKATASEDTSSGANQFVKEEPEVVNYSSIEATKPEEASNGVNQYVKEETEDAVIVNEGQSDDSSGFGGFSLFTDDDANNQFPQYDFLDKLKVELDLEDSFPVALLGVGGITFLWLTTSIVGAIDRIPLFPKLMEAVGLGYTIWFITRYLLFKKNRDELASKIEAIKQQVLGSKN